MGITAVRVARITDATEIARIQRDTWHIAYGDLLGTRALNELDSADAAGEWADAIEHSGTRVYLASEGAFTVGFCVAGPAPESEVVSANGELPEDAESTALIATVLVEPRWGRRGHAGRLLAAAAADLRSDGAERGVTWIAQSDHASLGFFRHAGWIPDGTVRTLDTGETTIREIRLAGPLDLKLVD